MNPRAILETESSHCGQKPRSNAIVSIRFFTAGGAVVGAMMMSVFDASAAGAPILVGPTNALQRQGWADADRQRDESRQQKVDMLRKMADGAASQGREIGVAEWAGVVRDIVGFSLSGDAPTQAVTDAIRLNANAKAQEVRRLREAADRQRQGQLQREAAARSRVPSASLEGSDSLTPNRAFDKYRT